MPNPTRDDTQYPMITLPELQDISGYAYPFRPDKQPGTFGDWAQHLVRVGLPSADWTGMRGNAVPEYGRLPPLTSLPSAPIPPAPVPATAASGNSYAGIQNPRSPIPAPASTPYPFNHNAGMTYNANPNYARQVGGTQTTYGQGATGGGMVYSPTEIAARNKIDAALGKGFYDSRVALPNGKSVLDKYQDDPHNYYWDEPHTLEGAVNSFIRDEIANSRNAAQWQQEHGNVAIPQDAWERWYYANRRGDSPDTVQSDGSETVY